MSIRSGREGRKVGAGAHPVRGKAAGQREGETDRDQTQKLSCPPTFLAQRRCTYTIAKKLYFDLKKKTDPTTPLVGGTLSPYHFLISTTWPSIESWCAAAMIRLEVMSILSLPTLGHGARTMNCGGGML